MSAELCPECNGTGVRGDRPPPKNFNINVPKGEYPHGAVLFQDALDRAEQIMSGGSVRPRSPFYTLLDALNLFNLENSQEQPL